MPNSNWHPSVIETVKADRIAKTSGAFSDAFGFLAWSFWGMISAVTRPLILITSSTGDSGAEFPDPSVSVAYDYVEAILQAGGIPLCLPVVTDLDWVTDTLQRADGVLLTGGGDIHPDRYGMRASDELLATCEFAKPGRDTMELHLVKEALNRRTPLLAICRGHQLVNVALGGTLYVDLPRQRPSRVAHCDYDRRFEPIHDVRLVERTRYSGWVGRETLGVNSTHHQAIHQLAPGLRIAAEAPDGVIEATEFEASEAGHRGWFLSVQFHPERLCRNFAEHRSIFVQFVQGSRMPFAE